MKFPPQLIALTLLAISAVAVSDDADTPKPANQPRVGAAPQLGDIQLEDSVLVTLIEQMEVPAEDLGPISEVVVREGQSVKAGELLARVKADEAELRLEHAKKDLAVAKTQSSSDVKVRFANKRLELARSELARAEATLKKQPKGISQSEMDKLRLEVDSGVLAVEQSELDQTVAGLSAGLKQTEVAMAEREIARRKIVSPVDGKVVEIKRRRGEWVKPGDSVLRIVRLDRLRVEGFLHGNQLVDEFAGRPVTLTVDLPGRSMETFTGEVVFVSPEINPVSGEVRVWAEVINKKSLLMPGLRGSLTIHPAKPKETARTP
ncbi:MAG: HlyD family efflux transporter periplasmic adaptor subunit [Planctomycetota bacterium]|nr:HlyD family efflux transporter periplasmic adaptor subunit [Planctomycetota bacterium]